MSFEVYENDQVTWNRTFLRDFLSLADDDTGAPGPLDGTLQRLSTATITVNKDTAYVDIPKATLGASTVALTWSEPVNLGSTKIGKKTQIEAVAGSDPTAEEITGVLVVNAAADDWVCWWQLPQSVDISLEGDGVSVDLTVPLEFSPDV